MGRVVVVGSANADLVVTVPRRPAAGETVLGADVATSPGGKGANVAVAAARAGAAVSMVGRVGDDEHGAMLRTALAGARVDVWALRTSTEPTGLALVLLTPDGENSIVVAPGANARLTTSDVDVALAELGPGDVLVAQLEVPMEVVEHAATGAAAAGARAVVNFSPVRPLGSRLLRSADPVVVNEHEARELVGAIAAADLARGLLGLGAASAVVTLGARGAVLADAAGVRHVAAPAVDVVDTTGAGDAFLGALAAGLARGADLDAAVQAAVRAGAEAVGRPGAQAPS
jgi:ribokinase